MVNSPYYRRYELPWEGDTEARQRFRRIFWTLFGLFIFFGILFPLLPSPEQTAEENPVPERLARVMIEQSKPKPPPPRPRVQEKPRVQTKPRLVRTPPQNLAHLRAQRQLNQIKDELADLRQVMDLAPVKGRNLSRAVLEDARAERHLLTANVGSGSGGITDAPMSRNFGRGAGSLGNHETLAVNSPLGRFDHRGVTRTGASGLAGRSREEIETVFDRNKGAIYALYERALRENPQLQGKLVLEFTIAPSGEVTMCRVVSSDLKDKDLEDKIVARVRLFHFEPRKVAPITTTKPIDFFPA